MTLVSLLIIQSVLGIMGIVPAYCLQMASIMGAANTSKHLRLATFVIALSFALPFVLICSLVLMWAAYGLSWEHVAIAFILLPWAHFVLIVASMLLLLQRLSRKE